ncbi:unnamed protein product, partial [Protopolystoma xenopodis]
MYQTLLADIAATRYYSKAAQPLINLPYRSTHSRPLTDDGASTPDASGVAWLSYVTPTLLNCDDSFANRSDLGEIEDDTTEASGTLASPTISYAASPTGNILAFDTGTTIDAAQFLLPVYADASEQALPDLYDRVDGDLFIDLATAPLQLSAPYSEAESLLSWTNESKLVRAEADVSLVTKKQSEPEEYWGEKAVCTGISALFSGRQTNLSIAAVHEFYPDENPSSHRVITDDTLTFHSSVDQDEELKEFQTVQEESTSLTPTSDKASLIFISEANQHNHFLETSYELREVSLENCTSITKA